MKRNSLKFFLICVISLTLVLSSAAVSWGDAYNYSSAKALAYAAANWDDSSIPKSQRDCVKFVRACVEAGGIPRDTNRKLGYDAKQYMDYLVKNDWAEVHELKTAPYYASYMGIPASENIGKIAAGDIILYKCNCSKCPKAYFHVAIAKDTDGNNKGKYVGWWSLYQHNNGLNDTTALKIACSQCRKIGCSCGYKPNDTTLYSIHFKSKENGFFKYTEKVTGLKAAGSAYNLIDLNWNTVNDADGYKVYRATSTTGTYSLQGTTTEATFMNKVATTGKTYYYKVKPYKIVNGVENLGVYSARVSAKTKLEKPVVTAEMYAPRKIQLTWEKTDGASGYSIYRKVGKNSTYKLYKTITSGDTVTYKNTGLKSGSTYYYKVKAYRGTKTKVYSAYSNIVSAKG